VVALQPYYNSTKLIIACLLIDANAFYRLLFSIDILIDLVYNKMQLIGTS